MTAIAVALLFAVFTSPAQAQVKSWRIDNLDVLLDVQQNGDLVVDETYTFAFTGNYHFVERLIPLSDLNGLKDIQVLKGGTALPVGSTPGTWNKYKEGKNQVIRINTDITDASDTWTIHYRAPDEIFFWDQGDELRWHVFDAEWPVPIKAVRATVKLPGSVPAEKMTHAVQTSSLDVQPTVTSPAPSTMVYEAQNLDPYTSFWLVTGFPKNVVKFTWTARRVAAAVIPKVGFALPILAFLGMLLIWRMRGRDEPSVVYAKYVDRPPSDLPPGLAGAVIDEKVDTKEVMATIVDLATRGYIDMTDEDKKGWISGKITRFKRLKPFDDLSTFERGVANALFDGDHPDEVTTEQLKNHFYAHVAGICDSVYAAVAERKLFVANPKRVRSRWVGYGFLLALILGVLTAIMGVMHVPGWGWFLAGSIVAVIIVWIFAPRMPKRTAKGAQEQRQWESFRNYLHDLTKYKDLATAQETFEKYLAYAIAFGVEKRFARKFEGLNVPPPTWYHPIFLPGWGYGGPVGMPGGGIGTGGGVGAPSLPGGGGGFSLDTISDSLFGSLSGISHALTSAPSSSGSGRGAFGGGGFSGGGFGGGFSGGGGGGGGRAG